MLEMLDIGGLEMLTAPDLDKSTGITVAFTGRGGGASGSPYDSLNLSFNVGDEHASVSSNRKRLGSALGISQDDWVLCQQVHGAMVAGAGVLERGRGGWDYYSALPRCDGMVTTLPGTLIGVLTADCVPLVLVVTSTRAIAVAHAGWKGMLAGVVDEALRKLTAVAGCSPGEVSAFVGPHIGPCCFEVEEEIAARFRNRFGIDSVANREEKPHLDLARACTVQLHDGGLRENSVHLSGICTACDSGYFSYRASGGVTGRQAGIAVIRQSARGEHG